MSKPFASAKSTFLGPPSRNCDMGCGSLPYLRVVGAANAPAITQLLALWCAGFAVPTRSGNLAPGNRTHRANCPGSIPEARANRWLAEQCYRVSLLGIEMMRDPFADSELLFALVPLLCRSRGCSISFHVVRVPRKVAFQAVLQMCWRLEFVIFAGIDNQLGFFAKTLQ